MKNVVVEDINIVLAERYGKNLLGQPRFRVVWSDDITEERYGTFLIYHKGIIVGNITETRNTRKYNYIQSRWILEMWKEEHCQPSLALPKPDGYECIYVFEDSKGNELPVILRPIELLVFNILNPQMDAVQKKQAIEDAHFAEIAKEEAYFEQMYSDNSSYELHKRHHGERISNAGLILPSGVCND